MTRSISAEAYEALQAGTLVARDFLWIIARDRESGVPMPQGAWSDLGQFNAQVIDPHTGGPVTRLFTGAGGSVQINDIPLVQGTTVQTIQITLPLTEDLIDFVRTYDCKQAEIQIFRGQFDPETRNMVAPATPRFVGFIDESPIKTPRENEVGNITVTATSNTSELTRANADTCSDASQRLRNPVDNCYQDVAVVGDWQMFWGKASGAVT